MLQTLLTDCAAGWAARQAIKAAIVNSDHPRVDPTSGAGLLGWWASPDRARCLTAGELDRRWLGTNSFHGVRQLEAAQLVERQRPDDARMMLYRITARGEAWCQQVNDLLAERPSLRAA